MKLIGFIVAASIGLAVLKVSVLLAAIVTPAVLAWWAMTDPKLFWGQLLTFTLLAWANAYPAVGLSVFGLLACGAILPLRERKN